MVRALALVLGAVAQAAWIAVLAREVGPSAFGVFGLVSAVGIVAATVFSFGLGAHALRSPRLDRTSISSMYFLRVCVLVVISAALIVGFSGEATAHSAVLGAAVAYVCTEQLNDLAQGVLSGQRRQYVASSLLVVQRLVPLAGMLAGLAVDQVAVGVGVGLWLGTLPSLAVWAAHFAKPARVVQTVREARAYWAATLASNIGQLDVVAVRHSVGLTTAGLYAASTRLVAPVGLVTNALLNVLVPELAGQPERDRERTFHRALRWTAVASGLVVVASPLVVLVATWVLGPAYEDAGLLMMSFLVASALSTVSRVHQSYLYAVGQAAVVAVIVAVAAVSGLVGILALGALFGVGGVAVVPVVVQLLILASLSAMVRRARRP